MKNVHHPGEPADRNISVIQGTRRLFLLDAASGIAYRPLDSVPELRVIESIIEHGEPGHERYGFEDRPWRIASPERCLARLDHLRTAIVPYRKIPVSLCIPDLPDNILSGEHLILPAY